MPSRFLIGALLAMGAVLQAASAQEPGKAASIEREAESLYRQGAFTEALKKFEEAFAAGSSSPAALYQAANCYRAALSDEAREIEMKRRAIPLFEKEIASGQAGVASYYYLASIYIHTLHDAVKGVEVARKGIALAERPGTILDPPAENLYRAARLHEFLGQDDRAAALDDRFLKAAAVSPAPVERAAMRISREKLAAQLMRAGKYSEAASVYEALIKAEPLRDPERHQWGLALLKAGKPEEAAAAWRGASSDDYRTELAYLEKVASRYAEAGKPASSVSVPGASSLSDDALAAKVKEAGAALRPFRQAAETATRTASDEAATEAQRRQEEILKLTPEERKARWLAQREKLGAEGLIKEGGGSGAQEPKAVPPARPVKSAEWLAAEREYFYLLTEYVKRGHLIRMFCFQNGLADLVFR